MFMIVIAEEKKTNNKNEKKNEEVWCSTKCQSDLSSIQDMILIIKPTAMN